MNGVPPQPPLSLSVNCQKPSVCPRRRMNRWASASVLSVDGTLPAGRGAGTAPGVGGPPGPDEALPRAVARYANPWLTFQPVRRGRATGRGWACAAARTGGTDATAGRLGAATVVPLRGSCRGDPMSFEDDEYWESEYDDDPKRPYADTTAT